MHIRPMHLILAAVCIAASTVQADAQSVTVHGVAFDSLRITRLRGALLSIEQSGHTAISDDSGRFRFEDVAPGPHTLVMQHDALDSLGIAVVRRAELGPTLSAKMGSSRTLRPMTDTAAPRRASSAICASTSPYPR